MSIALYCKCTQTKIWISTESKVGVTWLKRIEDNQQPEQPLTISHTSNLIKNTNHRTNVIWQEAKKSSTGN